MNPRSAHQLADDRHAARYTGAVTGPLPVLPALALPMRRSLGLLLVEAGLHLLTAADRPRRRASLAS